MSPVVRGMMTTNSSPPRRQAKSEGRVLVASRTANSRSTAIADIVAESVVAAFEVIDVDRHHRHRVAAALGALHQRLELREQEAAIVEPGELIGDRQFEALIEADAQRVHVALAPHQRAGAGDDLFFVDGAHDDVVGAEFERAQGALAVIGIDHGEDRQMPRRLARAHAGDDAEAVEALGRARRPRRDRARPPRLRRPAATRGARRRARP